MSEFKKLLIISVKNLKSRKWLNIKIVIALTCLTFLIATFSIFEFSMCLQTYDILNKDVSANTIFTENDVDSLPKLNQKLKFKRYSFDYDKIMNELGIENFQSRYIYTSYDEIGLFVDGVKQSYIGNRTGYNVGEFRIYSGEDLFTENDYISLKKRYGFDSFIMGEYPATVEEALVSENMLNYYSLTPEDVVGKQVSFVFRVRVQFDDGTYEDYKINLQDPLTVSGVIRQELNGLYGHMNYIGEFVPSICLHPDREYFSSLDTAYIYYEYSFGEWLTEEEIEGLKSEGFISVSNDYSGYSLLSDVEFIELCVKVVLNFFAVVGGSLTVGILFMIYLTMDKFVKSFSRSGGIMLINGMDKRQLNIALILQIVLLCLISMISSFILTVAVCAIFSVFAGEIIVDWHSLDFIRLDYRFFLIVAGICLAVSVIAALCAYLINYFAVRDKSVKEMLEAKKV